MIYTHRTLLPDEQFTEICSIRNMEGKCTHIAVAQGTTMHIIDLSISLDQIKESYPFLSPIEVIDSVKAVKPTVFVLLRNLNYFILELPDIVQYGSLFKPNGCFASRHILSHGNFFANQPQNVSSSTTAAINFNERRILHASHPNFIAVYAYHDVINLIPLNTGEYGKKQKTYIINVLQPNIAHMAFLGPTSCSARLAYIADSCNLSRVLMVYKYSEAKNEFVYEFEYELPSDSHYIISIQPELQSALAVIASDGVIRINAPEGLPYKVERLSSFMPPIVLNACYFFDDIYLLCDSCGGLSGMRLPVEGPIATENCKVVGQTSGIVASDRSHFFISSPFGDLVCYTFTKHENYIQIQEFSKIPSIGPIYYLECSNDGLICGTGRGNSSAIRLYEPSIACEKIGEINIENCLAIFTASATNEEIGFSIYICLCFYNSTRIVKYDGNNIENVEWPAIPNNSDTLLFSDISKNEIIHLSSKRAAIIDRFSGKTIQNFSFLKSIVAATLSFSNLVVANELDIIQVIEKKGLKPIKKFKINKTTLFIAATDAHIAVYLIDNSIYLFCVSDLSNYKTVFLPTFTIPVSMSMFNEDLIIIGTNNGNIIKISNNLETIITQNFGDSKILLRPEYSKNSELSILCSGDPPFLINHSNNNINNNANTKSSNASECFPKEKEVYYYNEFDSNNDIRCHFICADQCEDISKSDNIMCCLNRSEISIYKSFGTYKGTTKVRQTIPNMLNFVIIDDSSLICHIEKQEVHSLIKFVNGIETVKYINGITLNEESKIDINSSRAKHQISFFKYLMLDGKGLIVIGDNYPSITLLDEQLNKVSWQEMPGMPLTACVYQQYLVVSRENADMDSNSELIDFYAVKFLDGQYEMELKTIASAHFMTLDFLIIHDTYLVASDIQQALIIYKATNCGNNNNNNDADENTDQFQIEKVSQDYSPKQLTYLAYFNNNIFAASLTSTVYAYSIDKNGMIAEIGAFQCSSQVLSFASRENNLFYGTSSGGIGVFSKTEDKDHLALQAALYDSKDIKILADRIPKRPFQWDIPEIFVDLDNLSILKNLSDNDLNSILTAAKVDIKTYMKIFE